MYGILLSFSHLTIKTLFLSFRSYPRPKMVESLQGKHVKEIACGSGHSAAITTNGELYTWGQGSHGRLGHGDTANQSKPKQVLYVNVPYVSCQTVIMDAPPGPR